MNTYAIYVRRGNTWRHVGDVHIPQHCRPHYGINVRILPK